MFAMCVLFLTKDLECCPLSQRRPDPEIRARNKLLLDMTFLYAPDCDDEDLEGTPLSFRDRQEAAQYLLDMDTGDWSSDQIVHHCGVGCCRSVRESRLKLWVAIQAARLKDTVSCICIWYVIYVALCFVICCKNLTIEPHYFNINIGSIFRKWHDLHEARAK